MALAITPPGVFGESLILRGFKPRFETAFWLGPVRIAGEYSPPWRRQPSMFKILFKRLHHNVIML